MRYLTWQEAQEYKVVNNGVERLKFSYHAGEKFTYPQLSYEDDYGQFTLSMLCNGDKIYVGATRRLIQPSSLSAEGDVYYLWIDEKPLFKMPRDANTFSHEIESTVLARMIASNKVRTWTELDYELGLDGGEFLVDWQVFIDYLDGCRA